MVMETTQKHHLAPSARMNKLQLFVLFFLPFRIQNFLYCPTPAGSAVLAPHPLKVSMSKHTTLLVTESQVIKWFINKEYVSKERYWLRGPQIAIGRRKEKEYGPVAAGTMLNNIK